MTYAPGFRPVSRDPAELPYATAASGITLADLPLPSSDLIEGAKQFLKPILGEPVWNHSHRAFLFGSAIAKGKLSDHIDYDAESFYLACLFHDIGCVPENIKKTKMSFEFWGGIQAREWLSSHGASNDLADSVAEAIFRHTDFNSGKISSNGQLIQLGTLFDNIHAHKEHISKDLVEEIIKQYPRPGWANCFAGAMQDEVDAKPWAHATDLRESENWPKITNNALAKAE